MIALEFRHNSIFPFFLANWPRNDKRILFYTKLPKYYHQRLIKNNERVAAQIVHLVVIILNDSLGVLASSFTASVI
jgi:hypothetical protein